MAEAGASRGKTARMEIEMATERQGGTASGLPKFITQKELTEWMGWSASTIQRKIKQKCFPCFRFGRNDVRYKPEDILYYAENCREGSFDGEKRSD